MLDNSGHLSIAISKGVTKKEIGDMIKKFKKYYNEEIPF